jgi:hypothetical protein
MAHHNDEHPAPHINANTTSTSTSTANAAQDNIRGEGEMTMPTALDLSAMSNCS